MKWLVILLGVALFVAHEDVWNFATPYPPSAASSAAPPAPTTAYSTVLTNHRT